MSGDGQMMTGSTPVHSAPAAVVGWRGGISSIYAMAWPSAAQGSANILVLPGKQPVLV